MKYSENTLTVVITLLKKLIATITTLSYHILKLIITIKQLPNFPAYGTILHKSELKILLGISESTYKRRKDDGTLKPRIFCGQEYFYLSDLENELDRPEDKKDSKTEKAFKFNNLTDYPILYCPNHRHFEPPRCAIEGCKYDVEGDLWSIAPSNHSVDGVLPDIEEDQ